MLYKTEEERENASKAIKTIKYLMQFMTTLRSHVSNGVTQVVCGGRTDWADERTDRQTLLQRCEDGTKDTPFSFYLLD